MRVKLAGSPKAAAKRQRAKPAPKPTTAATWSKAPKRHAAAGFYAPRPRNPVTLPALRPEDNAQLDLTIASGKPGGRPRKAKAAPPRELERPAHRSIGSHLNSTLRNGGAWHPVNEQALLNLLPDDDARQRYKSALLADGMLPGVNDWIVMWRFPDEWRAILVAAGVDLPPLMALCGGLEVKPPGWKPDARWRAGTQPKAHALLKSWGVPTAIVHGFVEAHDVVESWGAPLKYRILTARGHVGAREPVKHETTGGKKKQAPETAKARRVRTDAPQAETTSTAKRKRGFVKHESK